MLVDDDPLIVESLGLVLNDEYETHSAATRARAKSLFSARCPVPALALVDLGLPPTPHSPEESFTLIGELLAFDPGIAQIEAELDSEVFAPIDTEALSADQIAERQIKTPGFRLDETLAAWGRRYIDAALKLGHGNLSQAARLLGVNRTTLYSKIERLADPRG